MAATDRQGSPESRHDAGDEEPETPVVDTHTTTPDRVVFTEKGNNDGWIATDLVVEDLQ